MGFSSFFLGVKSAADTVNEFTTKVSQLSRFSAELAGQIAANVDQGWLLLVGGFQDAPTSTIVRYCVLDEGNNIVHGWRIATMHAIFSDKDFQKKVRDGHKYRLERLKFPDYMEDILRARLLLSKDGHIPDGNIWDY